LIIAKGGKMGFGKNFGKKGKTIDDTVGFTDRLKYMALPLIATVGSYFGPELKKRYDELPEEQKVKYRKIGYASAGIAGLALTIFGGAKYYQQTRKGANTDDSNSGFTYSNEDK
jgi:hypothetical protein